MNPLGSLREALRNLNPKVRDLYRRWSDTDGEWCGAPGDRLLGDVRGALASRTGTTRTSVPAGVSVCLAEEYEAGVSATALAAKYRIHPATVWRHLADAGVKTGQRAMVHDDALRAAVHALRDAGLTLRQIAAQTGISHPSVYRLLAIEVSAAR